MIKGIIFDLGNTLLHYPADSETAGRQGATAMATWFLKKKHIKLTTGELVEAFLAERKAGLEIAHNTQTEVTATQSLQNALNRIDAPKPAYAHIEAAIKIYFETSEKIWQPYPDTIDSLKALSGQQYKMGLYSNATDDPLIQRLVNKNKLRPWLAPVFSSAGWGWRKPKPEPFDLIANRWNIPPGQIVVIGDTLKADVLGAQNAGMRTILVTMDEAASNDDNRHIHPNAVASSLSKLPEIVAKL